jgi:hypothetical protein
MKYVDRLSYKGEAIGREIVVARLLVPGLSGIKERYLPKIDSISTKVSVPHSRLPAFYLPSSRFLCMLVNDKVL